MSQQVNHVYATSSLKALASVCYRQPLSDQTCRSHFLLVFVHLTQLKSVYYRGICMIRVPRNLFNSIFYGILGIIMVKINHKFNGITMGIIYKPTFPYTTNAVKIQPLCISPFFKVLKPVYTKFFPI